MPKATQSREVKAEHLLHVKTKRIVIFAIRYLLIYTACTRGPKGGRLLVGQPSRLSSHWFPQQKMGINGILALDHCRT